MSNIVLTAYAEAYAKDALKKFLTEYNNPDTTAKGKRDLLHQTIMFAVMAGYNVGVKDGVKAVNDCIGPYSEEES